MKTCQNPACPDQESLGIAGEYVDGLTTCPKCGGPLTPAVEGEPRETVPPPDEEFVLAGSMIGAARVPLAASLLTDAGIPFYVKNELTQDLFGLGQIGTGYNPVLGPVEFWVQQASLREAQTLLDSLEAGPPAEEDDSADDDEGDAMTEGR